MVGEQGNGGTAELEAQFKSLDPVQAFARLERLAAAGSELELVQALRALDDAVSAQQANALVPMVMERGLAIALHLLFERGATADFRLLKEGLATLPESVFHQALGRADIAASQLMELQLRARELAVETSKGDPGYPRYNRGEAVQEMIRQRRGDLEEWAGRRWETTHALPSADQERLEAACNRGGFPEIVQYIDQGGDPNAVVWGQPLLGYVCGIGQLELAKKLLLAGATPDPPGWDVPLQNACRGNEPRLVALLLEHNADVDRRTAAAGKTALHLAVRPQARLESTFLLLHAGADPNIVDDDGRTALQIADQTHGVAGLLVLYGADSGDRNRQRVLDTLRRPTEGGETPIEVLRQLTATHNSPELARKLDNLEPRTEDRTPS